MKALLDHVARYEQLVRLGMDASPPLFLARYELRAVVGLGSFGAVFARGIVSSSGKSR